MFPDRCRNVGKRRPGGAPRAPSGRPLRSFRPQVEALEDRLVPAHPGLPPVPVKPPIIVVNPQGSPTPPASALTPAQIRRAYGIDQVNLGGFFAGDGTGQTIAIVDAGDNPGFVSSTDPAFATSDLATFDATFGLPDPPSFVKLNQRGQQGSYPPPVPGFTLEIALDVEWAHVVAPKANIVLVESDTDTFDSLGAAILLAKSLPGVSAVSMSFGAQEFAGETQLDSALTTPAGHNGVTFLASTGDNGAPGGYPAFSPNVLAVGGTTLMTDAAGNYIGETGWSGSGGGISQFEPQPAYQKAVVTQSTTQRTIPDVSMDADPASGVAVLDSFDNTDGTGPWFQVGGTSLACPLWAGIIAITNQARALAGQPTLDGVSQTLPRIYQLPQGDFHDIVAGNNGFPAGPGYDLVTGRGSPNAPLLIPDLAGVTFTNRVQQFHPFRYVVHTPPPDSSTFSGNLTVVNTFPQPVSSNQFLLVLGPLPSGVTLDPSVPTTVTTKGQVAIPLPVNVLPSDVPVRVAIKFQNPKHVPISTFFEGFAITLQTQSG
jgi:hypothetical protein